MDVMIDGVRYVPAPPIPEGDTNKYEAALACMMPDWEFDGTVKDYLYTLLATLWLEGECFSGKSPLGNSCWECRIYEALCEGGILDATQDEYDEWEYEKKTAYKFVAELIKHVFYGSKHNA